MSRNIDTVEDSAIVDNEYGYIVISSQIMDQSYDNLKNVKKNFYLEQLRNMVAYHGRLYLPKTILLLKKLSVVALNSTKRKNMS